MPLDKDDQDDTITDNTDSYNPNKLLLNETNIDTKPCIKHKTNKVSDINRHPRFNEPAVFAAVNENHVEVQKKQKKIKFSNEVKVKDSPNHSYTLDKICDKQAEADEMGYTIEDVDDKMNNAIPEKSLDWVSEVFYKHI